MSGQWVVLELESGPSGEVTWFLHYKCSLFLNWRLEKVTLIITGNQNSTAGRPSPSPHLSPWAVVSLERCDLMKGLLDECGFLAAVTMREVLQQP